MTLALTHSESSALANAEAIIERGQKTFVEVGLALLEIRDGKLYKVDHHKTFEDYCQKRWGFERRQAYRLIDGATATQHVSNWTQTAPATESQARPLTKLEPEKQVEAWRGALNKAGKEGRTPTAKDVEEAAEAIDVEIVEEEPKQSVRPIERHKWGMHYAEMAILDLKLIHPKDEERAEAADYVITWVKENLK